MKASLRWLRDYATLDASVEDMVRTLVETGTEVGAAGDVAAGIIVAQVTRLEPLPGSTHGLQIADVAVGPRPPAVLAELDVATDPLRVVTGAANVRVGDLVPYAPPGTRPPALDEPLGVRTYRGKYRSPGMLLSTAELGLGDDAHGLLVLERGTPGQPLRDVVDLDVVLDVDVTTNRPDCMCHVGLARELAAAMGESVTEPDVTVPADRTSAMATSQRAIVRVDDPAGCPRFVVRVIEDVRVGESPRWMQDRLRSAGLRPINNIVDVTNFVAHELGQPLHAFDLDKFLALAGASDRTAEVVVRRAREAEGVLTLDGVTHLLHADDMVVCAGEAVASIAGIIGGSATAVDHTTRNVLVEAASWDGVTIRASSRRLGVRTDASTLFEKGLSDMLPPIAAGRAARLMVESAGGHVLAGAVDEWPRPLAPLHPIAVTSQQMSALLGTPVDATEAATALAHLGFAVEQDGWALTVLPPHFRRDVRLKEDVIEEVGRMLGYERVPSTLPGRRSAAAGQAPGEPPDDHVRDVCLGAGFNEAITYSFVSRDAAGALTGLAGRRQPLALQNPLSEEWSVLRVSQLPGLCAALAMNLKRGVQAPALFEIGRVFWQGERTEQAPGSTADGADEQLAPLPREPLLLSVAVHCDGDAAASARALRHVQALFEWLSLDLSGSRAEVAAEALPGARPGRSATLRRVGRATAMIAELDAEALQRMDIRGRVVVGELDLDEVVPQPGRPLRYVPPGRFPAIVQDLAVTVPQERSAGAALGILREAGGPVLESAELYDEYRGGSIGEQRKGWTFRLTYRAADRTLTGDEAQAVQEAIAGALRDGCGAEVRR